VCAKAISDSIDGIAFGDLFLEDVLAYRLRQMKGTGLESIFPLWGLPTRALAEEMVTSGLRAKLTCVDTRKLDPEFAGRDFDLSFLSALPRESLWRKRRISLFCVCWPHAEFFPSGVDRTNCNSRWL
jgi:diphthamide synthase (EF-2-diphthine--ammonia ligase)